MKDKTIIHYGDPIFDKSNSNKKDIEVSIPNENEKPTLDDLTYGEKKTLMSYYSLNTDKLDNITLFKINNLWYAYYSLEGQRKLIGTNYILFDLCAQLIYKLKDEELINQFVLKMRSFVTEEEADTFIEELKSKQEDGPKLK